jgi:hypothetical protein
MACQKLITNVVGNLLPLSGKRLHICGLEMMSEKGTSESSCQWNALYENSGEKL